MFKQYADVAWNPGQYKKNLTISASAAIDYSVPAPTRGIDMLLAKFRGEEYKSEVQLLSVSASQVPVLAKPLSEAQIAFVTDGGLVPNGNPDDLSPVNADEFYLYSFWDNSQLEKNKYEVSHQGYDNKFVLEDPNRLIPLDAAQNALSEGRISKIFKFFYSTAGVMAPVEKAQVFGRRIAKSLKQNDVDGVILTSTCGTSTRCGAYMACEIEQAGIPVVHVTNLVHISEWVGCSRILCGNSVCHVFGNPEQTPEQEREYRLQLFNKALNLLLALPNENASLIVY